MGGGDMISTVTFEKSTWAPVPHKFEAGTPAIVETIGLGGAIDWVESIGFDAITAHEKQLVDHAARVLPEVPGLRVIGNPEDRGGVFSFVMKDIHPHDMATLLDRNGVAIRAGHHCAEPLMQHLGLTATARASFAIYTTEAEVDALVSALIRIRDFFV
jgi:cysteine desulfurase/selenocysteine lyase